MASKMGNLKQYAIREVVSSTDFNNLCAEMSGDPIIGHEIATGSRSDADLGDVNSGATGHIIKDIYQREGNKFKIVDNSGKIIRVVDLNDLEEERFGVLAGKSKTSGFPDFLSPGGGSNKYFTILGAAIKLEMIIDGVGLDLESDLQSGVLGVAPAANNTCAISDVFVGIAPVWAKTSGEHGYWMPITSIGSEIIALDGTIQCFQFQAGPNTEVFLAKVDTTNNVLIPIFRGVAQTKRFAYSNGQIITLAKAHYIFLDDNLTTIDTTINYPKWKPFAPAGPTVGDYWFKTSNKTWYRWSGAAWENLGRIYLGYAICDDVGCLWVEHVDYDLKWNSLIKADRISAISNTQIKINGPLEVSVAEKLIKIKRNITIDITTDLESGVVEAASTWYYAYIKPTGEFVISDIAPRLDDWRLGFYHPKEYWRLICFFWNDASSNIDPFNYDINSGQYMYNDYLINLTTITTTTYAKHYFNIPSLIQTIQVVAHADLDYSAGPVTLLGKEVDFFAPIADDKLSEIRGGGVTSDFHVLTYPNITYIHNGLAELKVSGKFGKITARVLMFNV